MAFFAAVVFYSSVYAGPRPNNSYSTNVSNAAGSNVKTKTLRGVPALSSYPGDFLKPSPGGNANLTNYTSVMPPARLDSSFSSVSPYPTNKWFTSIFTDANDAAQNDFNDFFGNRISPTPMTIVYDIGFPWSSHQTLQGGGWGYSVGGQNIKTNASDFGKAAVRINRIMAFSVQGAYDVGMDDIIKAENTKLKSYNDWSFTAVLEDSSNSARKMTSTFGKGFVFTYNYFTPGVNPRLEMKYRTNGSVTSYYYNNGGVMTPIAIGTTTTTDRIMIKNYINATDDSGDSSASYQYFGIYAPEGTVFTVSTVETWPDGNSLVREFCNITLFGTSESDRYLSIALLKSPAAAADDSGAWTIFNDYYQYAYNFITDTQVNWTFNKNNSELTTEYNFTVTPKRSGGNFNTTQTVFALYPHQWKNLVGSPNKTNTYKSIRGLLKVSAGSSFSTKHNFNGIVPFLTYELPMANKSDLQTYINYDKSFDPAYARIDGNWIGNSNTYYHGKAVARAANLIPVFHQQGDSSARDTMIARLKNELSTWYSGQNATKYFGYDSSWGGIIGSNPGGSGIDDFGASKFNDHHFHYGYFIYASAILAMFDPSFAESSEYKGMVDLLVKEVANPNRNDTSFPFLRNFDVYEGHSYANGRGGSSLGFGNDEESSSEAMNAWAGIYLWGLVTGNNSYIDLGVYGYTTQYEAIKNYYFNMDVNSSDPDRRIWQRSEFNHANVGMLFDNEFNWGLWWDPKITQTVMGIQVLPLTPSMLYLGYDTTYAQSFYNEMWAGRDTSKNNFWRDVWLRFKALFDAPGALTDWTAANMPTNFPDTWNQGLGDDGSSLSYSYHFLHFFNALGSVDTDYYSDSPSFLVMNKNGTRTFIAYNTDTTTKTVHFYKRSSATGAPAVPGSATVSIAPRQIADTQDFVNVTFTNMAITAVNYESVDLAVYGVYSDTFYGAIINGDMQNDKVTLDTWEGTMSLADTASSADAFEGEKYILATRTNSGWGGWAFRFADLVNSVTTVPKDMSAYYGGEFVANLKISNPSSYAGGFEIGFIAAGGSKEIWKTLSSIGFDQNSTEWQRVHIPLNSSFDANITTTSLASVTQPFIMRHNNGSSQSQWGIPVAIDSILWRKQGVGLTSDGGGSVVSIQMRNTSDNSESFDKITWTSGDYSQYSLANQYIDIALHDIEGNGWCIQIYTDNKSSVTITNAVYEGDIDSTTASGFVNTVFPSRPMIPIFWRPASTSATDILDPAWFSQPSTWPDHPWRVLKDIAAFSNSTPLHKGCEEIKFYDREGARYNAYQYGHPPDSKVRLYFMADLRNLSKVTYKANIIIEYFNE
ncbi:MAG: hypothetical protein LBQ47_00275 [Endomicrobium sp.]|nr:hypothetical protein [Endomicrobium sp.]